MVLTISSQSGHTIQRDMPLKRSRKMQELQTLNKTAPLDWVFCDTIKFLNFRTPETCCNLPKIPTKSPNLRVFSQKDANGIANSEDPDQTAPQGAV